MTYIGRAALQLFSSLALYDILSTEYRNAMVYIQYSSLLPTSRTTLQNTRVLNGRLKDTLSRYYYEV